MTLIERNTELIVEDLLGSTYALNENEYSEVLFRNNQSKL